MSAWGGRRLQMGRRRRPAAACAGWTTSRRRTTATSRWSWPGRPRCRMTASQRLSRDRGPAPQLRPASASPGAACTIRASPCRFEKRYTFLLKNDEFLLKMMISGYKHTHTHTHTAGPAVRWIRRGQDRGKTVDFVLKCLDFVLKMLDFLLKMLDFVSKMLDFVLKMLDFAVPVDRARPPGGDECSIRNDECCIKNDELCIQNDTLWCRTGVRIPMVGPVRPLSATWRCTTRAA